MKKNLPAWEDRQRFKEKGSEGKGGYCLYRRTGGPSDQFNVPKRKKGRGRRTSIILGWGWATKNILICRNGEGRSEKRDLPLILR